MKTLYLFRHGAKNPDGTLSEKGLAQARAAAHLDGPNRASHVFFGPISRTRDAALAFSDQFTPRPTITGPLSGIGSEDMVAEIVTPEFRSHVKSRATNWDAMHIVHNPWLIKQWSIEVAGAILQMFRTLEEGEVGVAFGHDPMWSLGAILLGNRIVPRQVTSLAEGEGLEVIRRDDKRFIEVMRKCTGTQE